MTKFRDLKKISIDHPDIGKLIKIPGEYYVYGVIAAVTQMREIRCFWSVGGTYRETPRQAILDYENLTDDTELLSDSYPSNYEVLE